MMANRTVNHGLKLSVVRNRFFYTIPHSFFILGRVKLDLVLLFRPFDGSSTDSSLVLLHPYSLYISPFHHTLNYPKWYITDSILQQQTMNEDILVSCVDTTTAQTHLNYHIIMLSAALMLFGF